LLETFKTQHPDVRIHAVMADALYGTATFVEGASALFRGVQVISQIRSNQNIRVGKRDQHVADYFATHPGTPYSIRIRGGEEVVAIVGSARLYVCAHKTKRFIVAIKYEAEETYRYLAIFAQPPNMSHAPGEDRRAPRNASDAPGGRVGMRYTHAGRQADLPPTICADPSSNSGIRRVFAR
jgi:hypothetical protein